MTNFLIGTILLTSGLIGILTDKRWLVQLVINSDSIITDTIIHLE